MQFRSAEDQAKSRAFTTKYTVSHAGDVLTETDAEGNAITYTYDWLGRNTGRTDAMGRESTFKYNGRGLLTKTEVPFTASAKTVKAYTYDGSGNLVEEKVANNLPGKTVSYSKTAYSYNSRGWLTYACAYDGASVGQSASYEYDGVGNLTSMTDGRGKKTSYQYDGRNRLAKIVDPMGRAESYSYDISSNLIKKTDRNGNALSMEYDGMNRLVRVSAAGPGGTVAAEKLVNTYAKTGSLHSQENENMTVTYSYDSHGRNIRKSQSNGIVEEFTYNMADQRDSFRLMQGGAEKMRLGYAYDAVGRLRQVNNGGSTAYANYTYDKNHNLLSAAYPSPGITATYTYGYANQLTGLSSKKGSTVLSSSAYTYYLDGNQASKSENAVTTEYEYDGVGRLAKESSASGSKAYAYDQAGNRASLAASGTGGSYSVAYAYDGNNRLLSETKASGSLREISSYVYDGNGNQIAMVPSAINAASDAAPSIGLAVQEGAPALGAAPEYRTYDAFNRLTGVTGGFGAASYKYQPDGLRLSKTVNGSTTTHIWDGADMVGEMRSGTISAKYLRGMGLIGSIDSGNTMRYYIHNGHGDTVKLTNSSGTVTQNYTYDAFGVSAGTAGDTNPFRYAGEYLDVETNTYYLRARYYNPATSRMLSEDTNRGDTTNPLSLNLYTYCYNNPIRYTDPSGNVPVETIIDVVSLGWSLSQFVNDPSWVNFGFLAWDAAATLIPYVPGSYAGKALSAGTKILSRADDYTKTGVWAMKAFDRGWEIEKALGGWGDNFPVIDWAYKTIRDEKGYLESIKSIKSIDITASSYQKASKLKSTLKGYVNALANFKETTHGGRKWTVMSHSSRTLEIAIPPVEMTAAQAKAFQEVVEYAKEKGIEIITRIVE